MDLIIGKNNSILRKKLNPVKDFDRQLKNIVTEMKKKLTAAVGVGLAANQVGINLALFIAKPKDKFYVFVNPKIELTKKPILTEEGCLSLPGQWGYIKRSTEVKINYQDLTGKQRKLKTTGLLAHIIQHEFDHLQGILFIDKTKEVFEINKTNE